MSLQDTSKNLEKAQRIKAALTTLKNELVSSYDSFKGTELEGPIGELMVHSINYLKVLPGEDATTPEDQSPPKEAEPQSIGARLGKTQREMIEAVKKATAHYW